MLNNNYKLCFEDLYTVDGIAKIDQEFCHYLSQHNQELINKLYTARHNKSNNSELILQLAVYLEHFIIDLFHLDKQVKSLAEQHHKFKRFYSIKRNFIQRKAAKTKTKAEDIAKIDQAIAHFRTINFDPSDEADFVKKVKQADEILLEYLRIYSVWALFSTAGRKKHKNSILFQVPKKINQQYLIDYIRNDKENILSRETRLRDGFKLSDEGYSLTNALDQANYCIYCHKQNKDSCSKGLKDKSTNKFVVNEHNVELIGCPLEEHISEMNSLKADGYIIGAFAAATIANPMIAATGHRICNDCMKSCIYQKQEPVDIPKIETQILNDVLQLPFGFEVYSLFTRWNPLNFCDYKSAKISSYKVLVVGLGPAGFSLAYYLIKNGINVVAIDGLKIESLPREISGITSDGQRYAFKPIKNVNQLFRQLDERVITGFGGVMEYGITVRWNKNYLTLIRLLLERMSNFRMYDGVRFGGTIDTKTARNLGFDHVALCLGAGSPNLVEIPNMLIKGVRLASDFLMSLQLTGAARKNTITALQIKLPLIVVGGGLTAIDTATESLAYYPVQVEKIHERFDIIGNKIFTALTTEEASDLKEILEHARLLRQYPDKKLQLLKKWGGVQIIYRKTLNQSPAYRFNHEEVSKALAEGISFIENINPLEIIADENKNCIGIKHQNGDIAARTILIAVGTKPNTIVAKEDSDYFVLNGKYLQIYDTHGNPVDIQLSAKPDQTNIFVTNDAYVSCFGDLHPSYSGNVVKAIASSKDGYQYILKNFTNKAASDITTGSEFFNKMDELLLSFVYEVHNLTQNIVEIIIKSPLASKQFQPGQFYRLQNYYVNSIKIPNIDLTMESIALTGAYVDKENGLISLIVIEIGGSSNLCSFLKKGEKIVLMGPTGTPTQIPYNETVMLVGGGLGNAVLFSIGKALRKNNCKILYFAGYKKIQDRYKIEEIQNAANTIIWSCEEAVLDCREQDFSFKGNIIDAIIEYNSLATSPIKLKQIDRMITIGSDRMMKAIAYERHNNLQHCFKYDIIAIASINSPMQCMMKEICGQCLQKHVDPNTKQESYVYSCFNQDQNMDTIDFDMLGYRLAQNSLQEKINQYWIKEILDNNNFGQNNNA